MQFRYLHCTTANVILNNTHQNGDQHRYIFRGSLQVWRRDYNGRGRHRKIGVRTTWRLVSEQPRFYMYVPSAHPHNIDDAVNTVLEPLNFMRSLRSGAELYPTILVEDGSPLPIHGFVEEWLISVTCGYAGYNRTSPRLFCNSDTWGYWTYHMRRWKFIFRSWRNAQNQYSVAPLSRMTRRWSISLLKRIVWQTSISDNNYFEERMC